MRLRSSRLAWILPALLVASAAAAGEVGFVEDYALARDRSAALRQLIPGTEDYYFYHALHALQSEQYDQAVALTKPWLERFGQTPRLTEIQLRHALLTYDRDSQKTLAYLRGKLNLHYNHQRVIPGAVPNLPTALEPRVIARATLKTVSLTRWGNLDNFEDSALDWLAADTLDWERRRNLLQRLRRPDVPNLPRLVAEDLRAPHPQEFGAYPVHRQMTLAQLGELLTLRPDLLNQQALVRAWVAKLQPGADEDWQHDPALTRAYLDRLLAFARRLAPAHNALKAQVLYHRLVLDRSQDTFDKALFLEYLALPRQRPYMAKRLLEAGSSLQFPADLTADFAGATLLSAVRDDEPLVRSYLLHFLTAADSPKEFEPYIDDVYLRQLFAEAKAVAGLGDPEQWAALLPPELFRQTKDRVDIDFAPTNKTTFAADEPVRLDLFVKNVPTLIVKVFEINAPNYYRTHGRELSTDVNLDGLVANAEQTHAYPELPLRRVARRFDFPQLSKPGVYVIDFIGGGKSSRALVRKGRLRPLIATGTAGQVVTVVDDANRPVKDATLWLGGQEYGPGPDGRIVVPFSTSPGRRPVVLRRGDFASLDYLDHQPESYHLTAGIYVDREALLSRRLASVIARPGLSLNGTPVSVGILEEVKLRIAATDQDGTVTTLEVPDFKLFEDRESVHEFRVPPRLAALAVTLTAKVKSLSLATKIDLSAAESFALNGIDKTDKIEDLHLAKFGADYVIEIRGRTGEPRPDRPVQLALKHRDFKEPVHAVLKTDARGRIVLGPLPEVVSVAATGPEGTAHTWPLPVDRYTYRRVVDAKAGETVTLPYMGTSPAPSRAELALFEVRDDLIRADRFDALAVRDGLLELRGLAAGDYELWLKQTGEQVRVRVVVGAAIAGHVLGKLRHLELPRLKPVQVVSVTADPEALTVKLADASPFTRVHVFATRYRPAFSAFADLGKVRAAELGGVYPAHAESAYLTGRNIGDEYRYVLDRQHRRQYPGNMLNRPELLLNTWAVRSTETGEQQAQGGEDYRRVPVPAPAVPATSPAPTSGGGNAAGGDFADLDFLADPTAVLVNLVPEKDGTVRVARSKIGPHALVRVVAVDPLNTTARTVALPEPADARVLDLRLRAGLDPAGHLTQQQQVTVLAAGKPLTMADAAGGRFEAYDSLARVYGLYVTLTRDPKMAEFAFVLNWPKLKPEERRALYSKYACHELNFFLARKDPAFFEAVVKPFLANKKDKTFLDHWLLGDDVSGYRDPWQYERLNTVERVLLAKRVPGEPAATVRHLGDLIRLRPTPVDCIRGLFETAVKGGDLDAGDRLGIVDKLKDLNAPEARPAGEMPTGGAMKPGGAPGGFGGRGFGKDRAGAGLPAAAEPKSEAAGDKPEEGKARSQEADQKQLKEAEKRDGATPSRRELEDLQRRGVISRDDAERFFEESRKKLGAIRQLYRRVPPTMEWAENNYYHLRIQQQVADLVPVGPFWLDYARHGDGPFLSPHLADAGRTFTEAMLALAVLDLPFEAPKAKVAFDGGKMTYTPAGLTVAYHEEVRPTGPPAGALPILVSEDFYRQGDRFRDVDGERLDKFVTGEFVVHTVYGGQVVVTNPSPSRQRLTVLIQVPVGAVPVANGQVTRSVPLDLEPYRTQAVDYLFYFPRGGHFAHFPAHVAKSETLVAAAKPTVFEVAETPSKADAESWEYVSQNGTPEQVLAFLNRENVHALDLEKIAFRMKDRAFFESVLALLKNRHAYQQTLWSYALHHNAPAAAREYLAHADALVAELGGPIDSPLLTVDPVARHTYEHLEYKPLVNARAHSLGQRRQIVNDKLAGQYHHFLDQLARHKQLNDDDRLAAVYYLLLQDRIDEALETFADASADRVASRLQYDYCAAYLDFFVDDPRKARAIAERYADHPVDRWREAFQTVLHQLDEAGGKNAQVANADDRNQQQGHLAATEPGFEFTLDNKAVQLSWQNLSAVRVNYYLMDVELLFSRNPFVQQFGDQFATIRPNATREVPLPAGQSRLAIPLPDDLAGRNVLVEVTAAGKAQALPYYAAAMDVRVTETYGQLRATDAAGKPLAKVYVKVYARLADGQVKFHKDGYTDHRGRFDYASVSTPEKQPISRFSILALSNERGAQVREAAPPPQ
jgi:hypothetical protein